MTTEYEMRLSLNVLDHLGLNLYSNIPAVVAEMVANAWDADATEVRIDVDLTTQAIAVGDNGHGMSADDANNKFLHVGYRRREEGPVITARGRHVMGRKGIGKLSMFAISNLVRVESAANDEKCGFLMSVADIRKQLADGGSTYRPTPLPEDEVLVVRGTQLTMEDLRMRATTSTLRFLRRRLARRFSVIGPRNDFEVFVNDTPITAEDREYFPKVEYLWSIGEVGTEYSDLCVNAKRQATLDGTIDDSRGWTVRGWIGTVDEQKSLGEDANVLPIMAWGKVAHEDLLADAKPTGVFAKYIVGELHADFADADAEDDIATSNRQHLKETDERFAALIKIANDTILREVGNRWRDWRNEDAIEKARSNPAVDEWYRSLGGDARRFAEQLFGKINRLPLEDEADRRELYKFGILAFERLRSRELLAELDNIETSESLEFVGRVFANLDEMETAQYGQIARGRLDVVKKFVDLVDTDAKERVIQAHLFNHLWLLNPSWERASTNARVEQAVTGEFDAVTAGLTPDERAGRIDIRYRTAAGKHVIIELKRYSVRVGTAELYGQLGKYREALRKCIETHFPDESREIECIAVLGQPPADQPPEVVKDTLRAINARIVTYDSLIRDTVDSYSDFLDTHDELSRIAEVISRLDDPSPGPEDTEPRPEG